jgi:hypothetical protein
MRSSIPRGCGGAKRPRVRSKPAVAYPQLPRPRQDRVLDRALCVRRHHPALRHQRHLQRPRVQRRVLYIDRRAIGPPATPMRNAPLTVIDPPRPVPCCRCLAQGSRCDKVFPRARVLPARHPPRVATDRRKSRPRAAKSLWQERTIAAASSRPPGPRHCIAPPDGRNKLHTQFGFP